MLTFTKCCQTEGTAEVDRNVIAVPGCWTEQNGKSEDEHNSFSCP